MFTEVRSMKFCGATCDVIAMETKRLAGVPRGQGGPTTRFTQAHSLTGIKSITDQSGSKTTYNIFCNIFYWFVCYDIVLQGF